MTSLDFDGFFKSFPYKMGVETLWEISKNDAGEPCVTEDGYSASLKAINYDTIKRAWYEKDFPHQVKSCDALYADGRKLYLIEFKTGKPKNFDIHRKIYDSIIALVEHGVLSWQECREHVQYLIVSKRYESPEPDSLLAYLEVELREPWDYVADRQTREMWNEHDIRKLTSFLFEKAFKLSLQDFDLFAQRRHWSN